MLDWQRSEIPQRKKELEGRIEEIRTKKLTTAKYLSDREVVPESSGSFFEDPWLAILYRSLFVDEYAKKPARLAEALNLSRGKLAQTLKRLEGLGAIRRRGQGYEPLENRLHLPPDHRLYPLWRNELRLLSTVRPSTHPDEDNYGFSAVCVGDEKARTAIRARFLEFLDDIDPWIQKAANRELFQINFDLFSWAKT